VAEETGRTHFRNTFVADVTLAAYVNESMRYRVMGRLKGESTRQHFNRLVSPSLQACHKTEAIYSSTNDGHDPVDLGLSGPSIPSAKVVNNFRKTKSMWWAYRRPTGMNKDPMIKAGIRISGFPTPLF